jgi:hypothetical protein
MVVAHTSQPTCSYLGRGSVLPVAVKPNQAARSLDCACKPRTSGGQNFGEMMPESASAGEVAGKGGAQVPLMDVELPSQPTIPLTTVATYLPHCAFMNESAYRTFYAFVYRLGRLAYGLFS